MIICSTLVAVMRVRESPSEEGITMTRSLGLTASWRRLVSGTGASGEAQVRRLRRHDEFLRAGCYRGSGPPGPEAEKGAVIIVAFTPKIILLYI